MFDYQLMTEDVKEMNMTQLTHNQFFIKDGEAWYRDFEREISCRNLVREIAVNLCIWEENSPEMEDDEAFDESILDYLQYGTNDQEGVLAMYYSAMWGMAEVRAWYMEAKDNLKAIHRDIYDKLDRKSFKVDLGHNQTDAVRLVDIEEALLN